MPTNKTDRFSMIPAYNSALTGEELLIVSKQTVPKKTHNVRTDVLMRHYVNRLRTDGVASVVHFGGGILGTGLANNPLRLDKEWLSQVFLSSPSNLAYAMVGDRVTRHLPISRKSWFTNNYINLQTEQYHPPCINIEPTGELRLYKRGNGSGIIISYPRFSSSRTIEYEQIIERGIRPVDGVQDGTIRNKYDFNILELFGRTSTGTFAHVHNPKTNNYDVHYFPLTDGSINELAFGAGYHVASQGTAFYDNLMNNSVAVFKNNTNIFCLILRRPTDSAGAIQIEVYTLNLNQSNMTGYFLAHGNCTTNSYAGFFSGTSTLRICDSVVSSNTSDRAALHNPSGFTVTLNGEHEAPGKTMFINVLQDPNNVDNLTLFFRGHARLISPGGGVFKYQYDLVFKLSISSVATSAIALSSYQGTRPAIQADGSVTNARNTIVLDRNTRAAEYLQFLSDGSIVVGPCNDARYSQTPCTVFQAARGINGYENGDIHSLVGGGNYGQGYVLNYRPGYGADIATNYKLFISSPIHCILGWQGQRGVITPRVLDLRAHCGDPSRLVTLGELPHVGKRYAGLRAWPVHLYIQPTANGILVIPNPGPNALPEGNINSLMASVYFLEDGVNSILVQQAYSRLDRWRPSYRPQGMSIPVSYGHPGAKPTQFWLTGLADTNI